MGEILDQAKSAENLTFETYRLRVLLSSLGSGAGKTTSACSVPDRLYYRGLIEKPRQRLLIDIDNRSESVAGWPLVKILKCFEVDPAAPKAWARLMKIKRELWEEARKSYADKVPFPYSAVIVDGNTSLFRICMNYSLQIADAKGQTSSGFGGAPAQHHYGPQMKLCSEWILSLLGLPCDVIFTGHENLVEADGQIAAFLPKVTGKLCTEVPKWFNETYLCWSKEVKDDAGISRTKFFWSTQKVAKRSYLKSSMNQLQKYWSGPIEIDFDKDFVGFKDLLARRFGKECFEIPKP